MSTPPLEGLAEEGNVAWTKLFLFFRTESLPLRPQSCLSLRSLGHKSTTRPDLSNWLGPFVSVSTSFSPSQDVGTIYLCQDNFTDWIEPGCPDSPRKPLNT